MTFPTKRATKTAVAGVTAILVSLAYAGAEQRQSNANADSSYDAERIAAIREQSNEAIRMHDAAGVVASYDTPYQITTGAGVLYHDNPQVEEELWDELFEQRPDVVYTRTPANIVVSSYLPRAAESGLWVGTWTDDGKAIEMGGSYSASWRKVDDVWKVQSEMFVTLHCKGAGC